MNVVRKIDFPEEILLTLRKSDEEFIIDMKRAAALKYYKDKKLSVGQCAALAQMSEGDFVNYLSLQNISIFAYETKEELLEDFKNA